ncbi:transposase family protein [Nonomuraea cavernae]|uniref:transposase family protein n=1 Tax=Nonomuraea cavernae TaxID=2045107 RepID=UPI003F540FCE
MALSHLTEQPSTFASASDSVSLLKRFERLPDLRHPRGVRHGLASLLTLASAAVLAGARSFTAIGEWIADAPAQADGLAYVILDGTLIPIDRCAEPALSVKGEPIDAWYSGKTHQHAGNLQALSAPGGLPLWIGEVEPGSVHDLTAARTHVLCALYAAAARGLPTLADSGYDGAGIGIHAPISQKSPRPTFPLVKGALLLVEPSAPGRIRPCGTRFRRAIAILSTHRA